MKIRKKPEPFLYPCPVVLVTCVDDRGKPNIITLAWVGIGAAEPPVISLAIRPRRYSYKLIEKTREFVVNIPTVDILRQTDFCGMVSGREVEKFSKSGLTQERSSKVGPPMITECPVNIECKLKKIIPFRSHGLFIGEIVEIHVDQSILNEKGAIDYSKTRPLILMRGGTQEEYWTLGSKIEDYGFSIKG